MRILTGVFTCDWGSLGGLRPSRREGPGLISGETRPLDRLRPCRSPLRACFGHRQRPQGPRSCPHPVQDPWPRLLNRPHDPPAPPASCATRRRQLLRHRNRQDVIRVRLFWSDRPGRWHKSRRRAVPRHAAGPAGPTDPISPASPAAAAASSDMDVTSMSSWRHERDIHVVTGTARKTRPDTASTAGSRARALTPKEPHPCDSVPSIAVYCRYTYTSCRSGTCQGWVCRLPGPGPGPAGPRSGTCQDPDRDPARTRTGIPPGPGPGSRQDPSPGTTRTMGTA